MPLTSLQRPRRIDLTLVITVIVTTELLRAIGPVLDSVAGSHGVPTAAAVALLVFATPALLGPLVRLLGTRRVIAVGLTLLAVGRLAIQEPLPRNVITVGVVCGIAMIVMVATLSVSLTGRADGPIRTGRALLVAIGLGVVLSAVWQTWDPVWRDSTPATVYAVLLAAALIATATTWWRYQEPAIRTVARRAGVIGPVLALVVAFAGSPGFVAAQTGLPTPAAAALIAGAVTAALVIRAPALPAIVLGGLTIAAVAGMFLPSGWAAGTCIVVFYWALGNLVARIDTTVASTATGAAAGILAGWGFVLVVLPYQAHYETPLPVSNIVIPVAAAGAVAAIIGFGRHANAATPSPRAAVAMLVACLLPVGLALTRSAPEEAMAAGPQLRILSWNIHYGVDGDARVAPDDIAAVIEESDSDIVVLQEVSRGWPIAGGADLVDWLPQRLNTNHVWAPAADSQFGNLILTDLPIVSSATATLDKGEGSQTRSFATVTVETAGDDLQVVTTHLQHRDVPQTRLAQIETLLAALAEDTGTVIAGDLNSEPGWPEIDAFTDRGYHSAQDDIGDPDLATSPADEPEHRVDWIFASPDVTFTDFALIDSTVSDHLPLSATVSVTG